MAQAVTARSELEAIVVPRKFERVRDMLIRERPVAQDDLSVVLATLKKHF